MIRADLDMQRMVQTKGKADSPLHVIFTVTVGDQCIGLPIECVRTVFHASAVTPVPLAPPRVIGLINLRGHVVCAICMHTSLGAGPPESPAALMVAVEHRGDTYALAVDKVGDVLEVRDEDRVPLLATGTGLQRAATLGVFRTKDQIIPVLNIEALLDAEHAAVAA